MLGSYDFTYEVTNEVLSLISLTSIGFDKIKDKENNGENINTVVHMYEK
ncbi:hypothetical protein GCM10007216_19790 [Thalassobacillus devorans]|uniref:Uncharacterized protein n=1 Tax=Thalassobacillus devorans TaxID=279813 RepID=A0ABQ1P495_9BACI|nr:hypothetical protein GCM10007216_19790 [Thalassobacillus devorans]